MYKNKILKIALIAILLSCLSQATVTGQLSWEHAYGGAQREVANVVQQTTDGGYIIGGYTESFGAGYKDMYLVKTDANGGVLWSNDYSGAYGANNNDIITGLKETSDGGYLFVGTQNIAVGLLIRGTRMVKTDGLGDTLWTKKYNIFELEIRSMEETTDGGYILAGQKEQYLCLMKVDSVGSTIWMRTYGDPLGGSVAESVYPTADGGYIIGGEYHNGTAQYGLIKTDALGDTLWTHMQPANYQRTIYDVKETLDSGYIAVGRVYPYGTMFKLNQNGGLEWEGVDTVTVNGYHYYSVYPTADSGYVYTGLINKQITVNGALVNRDVLILRKRDAIGNILWEKEYINGSIGYDVEETTTGGLVVGGRTERVGAGAYDMYVLLTDSLGNYIEAEIGGKVYRDLDLSCSATTGDIGLEGIVVQATLNNSSNIHYYGTTDTAGVYQIPLQTGTYTISIPQIHPYYSMSCPQNAGTITAISYDTVDFPLEVLTHCPVMEVDVSTPVLRKIVPSTYAIQYCNNGTVSAQNVILTVEMDSFLNVLNFSQAPTSQSGTTYRFNVGTVGIGQCDQIHIGVQVDSTALTGQTHCTEISITPDSLCQPISWNGMVVDVGGTCQNDSVFFTIENTNVGSLSTPRAYWVFEDDIIMRTGNVTIPNGSSAVISVAALPRKFYRIEIAQEPGIPWSVADSIVSAFVEGCVPDIGGGFNIGLPSRFPNGHAPTFKAIDCQQNRTSFDPNNKIAQPIGYSSNH